MLSLPGTRPRTGGAALKTLVVGAGEAGGRWPGPCDAARTTGSRRSAFSTTPTDSPGPSGCRSSARSRPCRRWREPAADACVVAIPSLPARRIAQIVETARACGLLVRYLPSFLAAVERDARVSDLRQLRVEDLLGRRELHVVSEKAAALISGRRVLVTGAGGSIGSELCRQITGFGPAALYLLDHDESNLHRLQLEIDRMRPARRRRHHHRRHPRPRGIDQVFAAVRPELVFHAAAHKHLPLLERHPCEAVKSNVLGTQNLVDAAVRHGSGRFVLISTDKAADPTSVLGATKRLAETGRPAHARRRRATLASVRFGNVLGIRGSFLSVLADQIARRRAGDGDAPGCHPVLHDGRGGGRPRARGRRAWPSTPRPSCSTWASRCDRGPRPQLRRAAEAAGRRDPLHRPAARREAHREGVLRRRGARAERALEDLGHPPAAGAPPDFDALLDLYARPTRANRPCVKELLRQLVPEYAPSDPPETPVSAGALIRTASDAGAQHRR